MGFMTFPPTDINLPTMIMCKVAYKKIPFKVEITKHRYTLKNGIPMPSLAVDPPAPPRVLNAFSCACKAEGRACRLAYLEGCLNY